MEGCEQGRTSLRVDADPSTGTEGWRAVFSPPAIPAGSEHQVVAVFDRVANEVRLYVDGERRGATSVLAAEGPSSIDDANNRLGMPQWAVDPNFTGTLSDVRIYDLPMADDDVELRLRPRVVSELGIVALGNSVIGAACASRSTLASTGL